MSSNDERKLIGIVVAAVAFYRWIGLRAGPTAGNWRATRYGRAMTLDGLEASAAASPLPTGDEAALPGCINPS